MLMKCISLMSARQLLVRTLTALPCQCKVVKLRHGIPHQRIILPSSHAWYSTRSPEITQEPENDSEHGQVVYKGLVSSAVKNVKIFSLSTSIIGVGLQPILFQRAGELGALGLALGGMCSFFIFLTPVLLHWITKKYVSVLYFKPVKRLFTAVTYSFIVRQKYTHFSPDDVRVPAAPGAFTSILVKGKPLFMDARNFDDPEAYKIMMGYDQPIDWSFPENIQKLQSDVKVEKPGGPQLSGEDEINKRRED